MNSIFSIILVAFCVSLYFPFWFRLIHSLIVKYKKNKVLKGKKDWYKTYQDLFNAVIILITIAIPAVLYLLLPISNIPDETTISDRVISIAIPYFVKLIFCYVILYGIIAFSQKKLIKKKYLRIFIINKDSQKFITELYTLFLTFIILLYPESEKSIIKLLGLLLFCLLSSNFCYLFFEFGLEKYSSTELKKATSSTSD